MTSILFLSSNYTSRLTDNQIYDNSVDPRCFKKYVKLLISELFGALIGDCVPPEFLFRDMGLYMGMGISVFMWVKCKSVVHR